MTTTLFTQQRSKIMEFLAAGIGCQPEDFVTERLTIVDRPEASPWYTVLAVTFGVGTVISVEPRARAFVERHAPAPAYRSFYPVLMQKVAEEYGTRIAGEALGYHVPGICWALSEVPLDESLPDGVSLRVVDADWMKAEMGRSRWENGLGTVGGNDGRELRNMYGIVLANRQGEVVAVAGVFNNYNMSEIGIDVTRDQRGAGLAGIAVRAAVREILSRGETPLYGCAATNIRSHRTALTSGFVPVYSDAAVS